MINSKVLVLSFSFILMLGMASAAFYVVDEEGNRNRVAPSQQAQENAASQSRPANSLDANGSDSTGGTDFDPDNFVRKSGDLMRGELEMSGYPLTGLPEPGNPSDVATKRYVDSEIAGIDTEITVNSSDSSYQVPPISDVLEAGNTVDTNLRFDSGLMFGGLSEASSTGIALGNSARATGENSVAVGTSSQALGENSIALGNSTVVEENQTVAVGDSDNQLDLEVSGDLRVEGDIIGGSENGTGSMAESPNSSSSEELSKDSGERTDIWAEKATLDTNGTQIILPERFSNSSYSVSITPVGSMARTGVFNKTDTRFWAKASTFTEVDIMVTPRSR